MKTLEEMVTLINKNFLIRYADRDFSKEERFFQQFGERKNIYERTQLISAGQYWKLVECKELAMKHFNKVLEFTGQNMTLKLRRGLKIDFVRK